MNTFLDNFQIFKMALRDKKTFIGAPSGFPSSLSKFWEEAYLNDRDTSNMWPFKGKRQLPTQGQVLNMYFYIRGLQKMSKVSRSAIIDMVVDQVCHCWKLANITTKTRWNMKKRLEKILKRREHLVKFLKCKVCEKELKNRREFEANLDLLWDVSSPFASHDIHVDRLHDDDSRAEDRAFLKDQQGARKMEKLT